MFNWLTRTAKIIQISRKLCFVEGTLVHTDEGLKEIQNIVKGDKVWSFNEITGRKEVKKVVSIFINNSSELIEIYFENEKIVCTLEHPFFIGGKWVEAKNLNNGDNLTLKNGSITKIKALKKIKENVKVYNFEVQDNHNYYVTKEGVLTHNNCGIELTKIAQRQYKKLAPSIKTNVDKAIDILRQGKAGGNQHALRGDRAGQWAIDVKGSGRGRGGLRVIYEKINEGKDILIRAIEDYH